MRGAAHIQLHLPQHFGARGRGGCVAQLTGAFAAATAAVLCLSQTAGSGLAGSCLTSSLVFGKCFFGCSLTFFVLFVQLICYLTRQTKPPFLVFLAFVIGILGSGFLIIVNMHGFNFSPLSMS